MKATELPPCKCGKTTWEDFGGTLGPGHAQWRYRCKSCDRRAAYMSERGGNLFLVAGVSDAIDAWLAGPVEATWADRADKIRDAEAIRTGRCLARIVERLGFDPHKQTLSDDQHKQWRAAWDEADRADPFVMPPEFKDAPMLPAAPVGLHAFIRRGESWVCIDPLVSIAMPVVPHPRRVRYQSLFFRLFADLNRQTGQIIDPEEIENAYNKDRHAPWYRFTLGNCVLTVGSRKRVYEIRCENPRRDEASRVSAAWERLGTRDQVTFSSDPLLIHAWTYEHMTEYIMATMEAAK